jgi:hypothetical protein
VNSLREVSHHVAGSIGGKGYIAARLDVHPCNFKMVATSKRLSVEVCTSENHDGIGLAPKHSAAGFTVAASTSTQGPTLIFAVTVCPLLEIGRAFS